MTIVIIARRAEVVGQVERREQLADALEQNPDSNAARWQSGFVRDGNQWRSFEAISPSIADSTVLKEYRARRQETAQTASGQLDLANWCKKQKLADQERAHLMACAALSSGLPDPMVLKRLGFSQIGIQWLSPEQLRDWQRSNYRTETSLKKWSTKLDRIVQRLSGSQGQHSAALAELRNITDVSAVPAIELILAGRDPETAMLAVDSLRRIDGYEASLALAKQAVFSKWPEVRQGAVAALARRRLEDFVPPLINLLATAPQGEYRVYQDEARGVLYCSYLVAIETEDQFQIATFENLNQFVDDKTGRPLNLQLAILSHPQNAEVLPVFFNRISSDQARNQRDRLYSAEQTVRANADRIQELNSRVIAVLSEISGNEPKPDPRSWWKWWHDQIDVEPSSAKSVVIVDEYDESTYTPVTLFTPYPSCFAAGTSVTTDRGMLPIEKIQIGDRVLSQDIETGELACKPVLQTTVRPPRELRTLRWAGESIICTGGHRFWASGPGWVKARDFEPHTLLHTVTGNVPARASRNGETAETYNLVVADFHAYFVGTGGLLSQDVLLPKSTDNLVPGLSRANTAAPAKK